MNSGENLRTAFNCHCDHDHEREHEPGHKAKERSVAYEQRRIRGRKLNQATDPAFDSRQIVAGGKKSGNRRGQNLALTFRNHACDSHQRGREVQSHQRTLLRGVLVSRRFRRITPRSIERTTTRNNQQRRTTHAHHGALEVVAGSEMSILVRETGADRRECRKQTECPTHRFIRRVWLVSEVRRNHEESDRDDRDNGRPNAHHEEDLSARARRTLSQQRPEKTTEACCQHRCGGVDGQQQGEYERDPEKRVHLVFPAQLSFLFLDQAIELVEKFSISLADRVDDAGQHWFDFIRAVAQQSVDDVLFNAAIEFFARHDGSIKKRTTVLAALEQFLFEETVERGHQSGVSDLLVKDAVNVTHAYFTEPPGLFHHLAFQLTESKTSDFARPAKSTQQKSRGFHGQAF